MTVFAPTPRASASSVMTVKAGFLSASRAASRRSWINVLIVTPSWTVCLRVAHEVRKSKTEGEIPGPGNAIQSFGDVIPRLSNAIPRPGIAIPAFGITTPSLGVAIPSLRIAIPKAGIATPRAKITLPRACRSIFRPCRDRPRFSNCFLTALLSEPLADGVEHSRLEVAVDAGRALHALLHRGGPRQVVIHVGDGFERGASGVEAVDEVGEVRVVGDGRDVVRSAVEDEYGRVHLLPLLGQIQRRPLLHVGVGRGVVDEVGAVGHLLERSERKSTRLNS